MAVRFRVQRMITAKADIDTRVKSRAALANDDIARNNLLTTENLHAQAFGFRVSTILAATACFFMSHFAVPVVPACIRPGRSNSNPIRADYQLFFLLAFFFAAGLWASALLAEAFLAAAFLAAGFLAAAFLAAGLWASALWAEAFFAAAFFVAAFFGAGLSAAFSAAGALLPEALIAVISTSVKNCRCVCCRL